jgi:signal transduction histidine kinase
MVKKDRLEYDKEQIDFSNFLRDRIEFFDEIALGNHHRVISKISDNIEIYFNSLELQRVIDNNLSNAIKYAKRDTDITVSLQQKEQQVLVRFINHSHKIIDTERIFEAFHREEFNAIGFGLGLEIVKSICDKEGVEVVVTSDEKITVFEYIFKVGGDFESSVTRG